MSRCFAAMVVSVAGAGLCAGSASGQVSFGPSFVYSQITAPAQFASPPNGGFVTTDTANGVTLTGDGTLVTPQSGSYYTNKVYSFRKFSVGQFPVGVTLSAAWEFKFISANFGAAPGVGTLFTHLLLVPSFGGLPQTAGGFDGTDGGTQDTGAAVVISDSAFLPTEFLLPAYSEWYVGIGFEFQVAGLLDPTSPLPHRRYTFEAGGLTPYAGFSASIAWHALPSPGTWVGVAGFGAMGLRRRR